MDCSICMSNENNNNVAITLNTDNFKETYDFKPRKAYCENKWYDWITIPNYHFNNQYYKDSGVFSKDDVLDTLSDRLFPEISKAGNVPEDYNVAAQKTLLCYLKADGKPKNIVEIEGSVFINKDDIFANNGLRLIPKDKPVVLYCRSGNRSTEVMNYLKHNGFLEISHLEGGIISWVKDVETNKASY